MSGPLSASKPYPSAEGISPDAYSLRIISPAYASPTGELNAILQYIYHSFYFEKYGFHDIAETLKSIAVAEMRHLDLLGETILALGAPPVFCRFPYYGFDYYSTKYVAYSRSLKFMLEDDLLGERQAARDYCRMENALKNSAVKEIVSRIREDELLHIKTLENILKDFKG